MTTQLTAWSSQQPGRCPCLFLLSYIAQCRRPWVFTTFHLSVGISCIKLSDTRPAEKGVLPGTEAPDIWRARQEQQSLPAMKYLLCARPFAWCTACITSFHCIIAKLCGEGTFITLLLQMRAKLCKLPNINELVCGSSKIQPGQICYAFHRSLILPHRALDLNQLGPEAQLWNVLALWFNVSDFSFWASVSLFIKWAL